MAEVANVSQNSLWSRLRPALPYLLAVALLNVEILGRSIGWAARVPQSCSRHGTQDCCADADPMEIRNRLSMDTGGHCLN